MGKAARAKRLARGSAKPEMAEVLTAAVRLHDAFTAEFLTQRGLEITNVQVPATLTALGFGDDFALAFVALRDELTKAGLCTKKSVELVAVEEIAMPTRWDRLRTWVRGRWLLAAGRCAPSSRGNDEA